MKYHLSDFRKNRSLLYLDKKHLQLTPKYRYKIMQKNKINISHRITIEESCKRHKIEIVIMKSMDEHMHMIVDLLRIMIDNYELQIIKRLSAYLLFLVLCHIHAEIRNSIINKHALLF